MRRTLAHGGHAQRMRRNTLTTISDLLTLAVHANGKHR
jgi:hypothetical protein